MKKITLNLHKLSKLFLLIFLTLVLLFVGLIAKIFKGQSSVDHTAKAQCWVPPGGGSCSSCSCNAGSSSTACSAGSAGSTGGGGGGGY